MTNDNKKVGNSFEQNLCQSLFAYGFWAHNLAQNSQGQPFDVIAVRNGQSHPIDCKVCEKDIFKLNRMEENQISSMTLWRETGNGEGWFAVQMSNGSVFFLPFSKLEDLSYLKTVLSQSEIKQLGIPLREWVAQCK